MNYGYLKTVEFEYDGLGQMLTVSQYANEKSELAYSPIIQRFHYDSESRITKIELLNHSHLKAIEFEYDPLGRRTEKRAIPKESFHQTETTSFDWIGMQMVHEHNDKTKNSCLYIYNDGSYEPLARIEKHDDDDATAEKISYYSNHINGCPDAMLDDEGNIIWIAKITTFGKAEKELKVDRIAVKQNLRYQGQYLDRETGLHYNTFRYYDPEIGRFTQQDPIGLAGGFNLNQYAPNMIHWIDPWGWARNPANKNKAQRPNAWREHHTISQEMLKDPNFVQQMNNAGISNPKDYIDRQTVRIPAVEHDNLHGAQKNSTGKEWNSNFKEWYPQNPHFTKQELQPNFHIH